MRKMLRDIVPCFLINWYHLLVALGAAVFFGFPSKKIKVIGVTGTNGKSTTIKLITAVLEEAGFRVAALSSIDFKKTEVGGMRMTMPGRGLIQRFLRSAVKTGCQYAVIEVTSEGIIQHRHRFIDFEIAVFTNLSPEHIESHGSFENYKKAKGRFFKAVKECHVVNADDKHNNYFLNFEARRKYIYGLREIRTPNAFLSILGYSSRSKGINFELKGISFHLDLFGEFNVYNALAALCVGLSQGISLEVCKKGLERVKGIPGRMELVIKEPLIVIVDYAFTPNALEKVYQTVNDNWVEKKMICVLGSCGGGRDKWKRPVLGGLAGKYCDRVIVTNEDPYDEDPMEIIDQVSSGVGEIAEKVLDRREAIRNALKEAEKGDVIVITGKGSEQSICLAEGKRIPWDDRQVVREEIEKIKG